MGISNPTVEESAASAFETIIADAAGESILAVGFGEETTTTLIEQLGEVEEPPTVQLLASDDVLRWVREDFLMASAAAELVAADTFSLRVLPDPATNQLLITDGSKTRFPDVLRGGTSKSKRIYASYRLQEWEGSDIYDQMTGNNCPSLSNGGYEIIEMLASYADQGHPPDLDELPFAPFDPDTEAESGGGQ